MTSPDACQSFGVHIERVALLRLWLSFLLLAPGVEACTKHLLGIFVRVLLPLRVPETHRFPRSSNQIQAGSSSS